MYVCGSDWFKEHGLVKHRVHCKSTSHPPHQISPCPLLSASSSKFCWMSDLAHYFHLNLAVVMLMLLLLSLMALYKTFQHFCDKLMNRGSQWKVWDCRHRSETEMWLRTNYWAFQSAKLIPWSTVWLNETGETKI